MIRTREPTAERLRELAGRLRPADRAEVAVLTGTTPLAALERSVAVSARPFIVELNGQPLMAVGFMHEAIGDVAYPWMLTAPVPRSHHVPLLKGAMLVVADWCSRYKRLENVVWDESRAAKSFIRALGFTIDAPQRNHTGALVSRFWMEGRRV